MILVAHLGGSGLGPRAHDAQRSFRRARRRRLLVKVFLAATLVEGLLGPPFLASRATLLSAEFARGPYTLVEWALVAALVIAAVVCAITSPLIGVVVSARFGWRGGSLIFGTMFLWNAVLVTVALFR